MRTTLDNDRFIGAFPPVGRCIYCGERNAKLTEEHIVPRGLNGNLKLPEASCGICQGKIQKVEDEVLGKTFAKLRYRYDLKSYNKKNWPTEFQVTVGEDSDPCKAVFSVPNSSLPFVGWALPVFELPGCCTRLSPEQSRPGQLHCVLSQPDASHLLSYGDGKPVGMNLGSVNTSVFARFLAKIAHSFTYAVLGDGFEPCLPRLILDGSKHPTYWVGGTGPKYEAGSSLWMVQIVPLFEGPYDLGVRIRLFGFLDTPFYLVAVGRLTQPSLPNDCGAFCLATTEPPSGPIP